MFCIGFRKIKWIRLDPNSQFLLLFKVTFDIYR